MKKNKKITIINLRDSIPKCDGVSCYEIAEYLILKETGEIFYCDVCAYNYLETKNKYVLGLWEKRDIIVKTMNDIIGKNCNLKKKEGTENE